MLTTWRPDKKRPSALIHLMEGKRIIATVSDFGERWKAQVIEDRQAKGFATWRELGWHPSAEAAQAACDRELGVRR